MVDELNITVLPTGCLALEWGRAGDRMSKSQQLLQEELARRFKAGDGSFLLFLGFCDSSVPLSVSLEFWRTFAAGYARKLVRTVDLEQLRDQVTVTTTDEGIATSLGVMPLMAGAEYVNADLLSRLWAAMERAFQEAVRKHKGPVAGLIKKLSPRVHLVGRVFFHLVESKDENSPFAFLATYSTGLNEQGQSRHLPLKHALAEYGADSKQLLDLLATVYLAAEQSAFIREILESGEIFHPLSLAAREAYGILKECPWYDDCGILCRIPDWWKNKTAGLRVTLSLGNERSTAMGMETLLDFQAQLLLGDESISEQEARRLLAESEGLAFIKGKWVEVDPQKLQQTLAAFQQAHSLMQDGGLTLREAMRLQWDTNGDDALGQAVQISYGQWLESLMARLDQPETVDSVRIPKDFRAQLRPYQQQGLNWLAFLNSLGLGICLADDMGLGKTVQMLALLTTLKHQRSAKGPVVNLLVLPASLLGNWQSEIQRFAPTLKVFLAHPANSTQAKVLKDGPDLSGVHLVITTYALCQRYVWLAETDWNLIILDEAQAIKNPGTKQSRAVKSLKAQNRIAMTGTPIENRLADLWSLFDFLNPGLLGTAREFTEFTKGLRSDPGGYARLKRAVSPYILRRLKTDKTIISDLPDKVEMKTCASLSKKQIVLYQSLVQQLKVALEEKPDGIQRRGLVLASLMKFKQLCNHPDQYTGQGHFDEADSGKFQQLRAICETIREKREKVLVFTQFKEIIEPLAVYLESLFEHPGLVLHGGTAIKKRKPLVDRFQSNAYLPFMILSLKAGGVGLNLTAANHVIHFDRWWNPAVENQATDRAFRIGQHRNVVVHKFITQGTVEEKIDAMLTEKAELADQVISATGEQWITEMDNQQLVEMFTLTL